MKHLALVSLLLAGWIGLPVNVLSGPEPKQPLVEEVFVVPVTEKALFTVGVGYLQIEAEEIVYGGAGPFGQLSKLIWNTDDALTIDLGLAYDLSPRFSLFANGVVGLAANNYMVDFDWLGERSSWTDRSNHGDTELDQYFQIDLGLSYMLFERDALTVSALGGFRYTDVTWTAYGGDYIYSSYPDFGFFRDDRGSFPDGEAGISYRQMFPGLYVGPAITFEHGRWSVEGAALVGVTIGAEDRDRHWQRNLIFEEKFHSEAFYGVALGVNFQLRPQVSLYLEGAWDYYPLMKGTTEVVDTITGERDFFGGDAVGASLESWQIKTGVLIRF